MTQTAEQRIALNLETRIATELKGLLAGVPTGSDVTVSPSSAFCSALEIFVPRVLRRRYPEWAAESLDGLFVASARKTDAEAVEIIGTSILISDQTVTPLQINLAFAPPGDGIQSFRVRLGEPGGGRLGVSGPGCNSQGARTLLATVVARSSSIDWVYAISSDAD